MKIAVICESELLQKSLEMYLKDFLAPLEECEFVVSDYQSCDMKPVCLVGSGSGTHVKTPFTQESLLANCKVFYATYCQPELKALSPKDSKIFIQIDLLIEETLREFRHRLYEILSAGGNAR
ncbi:hypothetical protein [uncultured Helicobacter sp.]|uniref:hypothetical protein n=1 Tax=uncultured Helicobacter sp. TaxID=175537 RepID=UPI00261F87BC|nr:hypothetical protein [uncultured Helicobacter sp.]